MSVATGGEGNGDEVDLSCCLAEGSPAANGVSTERRSDALAWREGWGVESGLFGDGIEASAVAGRFASTDRVSRCEIDSGGPAWCGSWIFGATVV